MPQFIIAGSMISLFALLLAVSYNNSVAKKAVCQLEDKLAGIQELVEETIVSVRFL